MRHACHRLLPLLWITLTPFFLVVPSFLRAQTAPTHQSTQGSESPDGWNIDVGPTFASSIRYLHMFSTVAPGIDGAITHPLGNGLSVGGRVNIAHFFGRSSALSGLVDNSGSFPSSNLINILGDVHYLLPSKIVFGVDLGLGMVLYNGNIGDGFAKIFYAGYQWEGAVHTWTFSLYFDQTTYQKNLGLRAAIRL
jgi:hypothetical protein